MLKIEVCQSKKFHVTALSMLLLIFVSPLSSLAQTAKARNSTVRRAPARAAATRGPISNPSGASTAQITTYLNRLRGKLIQAWLIPDGNNRVTITGNFSQDGLSDNLKGVSNPKNDIAELAAMEAFNKCMPLETPPAGLNGGKVTVDFISNADPHGSSKSSVNLRMDPVAAPKLQAAAPVEAQASKNAASQPVVQPAAAEPAIAQPAATPQALPDSTTPPVQSQSPVFAPGTAIPPAGVEPTK